MNDRLSLQESKSLHRFGLYYIFTINDLLNVLPHRVGLEHDYDNTKLFMTIDEKDRWVAGYHYSDEFNPPIIEIDFHRNSLIEALYALVCWCGENKILNDD